MISLFSSPADWTYWQLRKRYEKVAGAKVNFDKSEGLQLGAWRRVSPCQDPFAGMTDLSASSGCGSDQTSSWSKIGWK